ncbi:site-specific recombinase XerD, partial [Motilibacter rhizosphaerae]
PAGGLAVRLGEPLLDAYLEFVGARSRANTLLATAFDLKVFFGVVAKSPAAVTPGDVLGFVTAQRAGTASPSPVVVAPDGPGGVSVRTVRRRLSSVSGLFAFLHARGDVPANPVPRSLPTRRERSRPRQGVPLLRPPRTLPTVLSPADVDALTGALRTHRDRAMVAAMVLGGLRRCEVLGLRMQDLQFAERRVFIADGKGGHQRLIPVSGRFFAAVRDYLELERPPHAPTERVFVVLKGPTRGQPLSASGVDEVLDGARRRAGLSRATCHQLRHTCLTRLREAGMALEAIQAQAGHASIESTRIYLHLGDDWLAGQYRRAADALDAQALAGQPAPVLNLRGRR